MLTILLMLPPRFRLGIVFGKQRSSSHQLSLLLCRTCFVSHSKTVISSIQYRPSLLSLSIPAPPVFEPAYSQRTSQLAITSLHLNSNMRRASIGLAAFFKTYPLAHAHVDVLPKRRARDDAPQGYRQAMSLLPSNHTRYITCRESFLHLGRPTNSSSLLTSHLSSHYPNNSTLILSKHRTRLLLPIT